MDSCPVCNACRYKIPRDDPGDTTKRTRAPPGAKVASPTPANVQHQADLQAAIFLSKTGLTLEQAMGQEEADIPVAPVLTPLKHEKPFVTEEQEISLGTQMFNLHRWYLRMSNDKMKMFNRDHDFFCGEDDFWVYFKDIYHIYHRLPSTPLSSPFGFCKYHLPLH